MFDYGRYSGKVLKDENLKDSQIELLQIPRKSSVFQTLSGIYSFDKQKSCFSRKNFNDGTESVIAARYEDEFYRYNRKNKIIDVEFGVSEERMSSPNKKEDKAKDRKNVRFGRTKDVFIFDKKIPILARSKSRKISKTRRKNN